MDLLESQVKAQEKRIQVLDKKVGREERPGHVEGRGVQKEQAGTGLGTLKGERRKEVPGSIPPHPIISVASRTSASSHER